MILGFDPKATRPANSDSPIQLIPSFGAYSLDVFTIPGVGTMLAIANRQVTRPFSDGDYSVYDQESFLYKWTDGNFGRFQTLGGNFRSVYHRGVSATQVR
ncbi:hypothetical protein T484DRAFT_1777056 [Baffinella frigidus]|nr:hypothetical protein T484DRAFT_1777056 [Cryptophyta sp. CCMP2293]